MGKKKKDKKEELSLAILESRFFERPDVSGTDFDLNYCIPINIGIIAQDNNPQFDQEAIKTAVIGFGEKMEKLFGAFSGRSYSKNVNDSRVHMNLLVLSDDESPLTSYAAGILEDLFYASRRAVASVAEMKKKSLLVLALWDGIASGNTFEDVQSILKYDPASELDLSETYKLTLPENRPVFQILLPVISEDDRDSAAEKNVVNYTIRTMYSLINDTIVNTEECDEQEIVWFDRYHYLTSKRKKGKKRFEKNAKKIKQFNKLAIKYSTKSSKRTQNIWNPLKEHYVNNKPLSISANAALLRYICYDAISMHQQTEFVNQLGFVLILACAGLFCFSFYSDLYDKLPVMIFLFIGLFIAAYIYYWFKIKKSKSHSYYLEFRSLAEGTRIQCHWYTAGITESTGNYYKIKFSKDMSWARYALNSWNEIDTKDNRTNGKIYYPLVKAEYLGSQIHFFQGKIDVKKRGNYKSAARRLGRITTALKVLWCIVAALLGYAVWTGSSYERFLIFIMGILNVLNLAVSYFKEKRLYKIQVSRYTYSKLLVEKARTDYDFILSGIKRLNDELKTEYDAEKRDQLTLEIVLLKSKLVELIRSYGIEALAENAEWLLIENDREPDVPNG